MKQITSQQVQRLIGMGGYRYEAIIRGKRGKAKISDETKVLAMWDTLPTGSMRLEVNGKKYTNLRTDQRALRFMGAFI